MSLVQDFSARPTIDLQPKILSCFSQKSVTKSTFLLNYGFVLLNISTLTIIGLGIYALHASPYTGIRLVIENNTWIVCHNDRNSPSATANIPIGDKLINIGSIPVNKGDFMRFPEFFQKKYEEKWWNKQRAFYGILRNNSIVDIETFRNDDKKATGTTTVQKGMHSHQIIKRTLLVYVSSLLWMVIGILAFLDLNGTGIHSCSKQSRKNSQQSPSPLKLLCAFFSCFGALYLASAAPIASRDLTLSPSLFHILLMGAFIGAGGLITLVHFSLVFPKPKPFIASHPKGIYFLYAYFFLTVILYLSGICAFGAFFPFLMVWTLIMVYAFFHSWIQEKDPLLKQQIRLGLIAPVVGGIVFIFVNLLPPFIGLPPLDFNYFALISLLLPFTISFVTENYRLYFEKTRGELEHREEREKIMDVLHDSLGNDLSHIKMCSEVIMKNLSGDIQKVQENVSFINETSQNSVKQLRDFIWATDTKYPTWNDFINYFKEYGSELFQTREIPFDFQYSSDSEAPQPYSSVKFYLLSIYKEILGNILKHAQARNVSVNLSLSVKELEMKLQDDGIGFVPEEVIKEGHYGIKKMQKRVEEMGGTFQIHSKIGEGTLVHFRIPLGDTKI